MGVVGFAPEVVEGDRGDGVAGGGVDGVGIEGEGGGAHAGFCRVAKVSRLMMGG